MENKRGRKPKWLTVERFEQFVSNDFYHLKAEVGRNTKLLWIVLAGLIVAAVIERVVG